MTETTKFDKALTGVFLELQRKKQDGANYDERRLEVACQKVDEAEEELQNLK